MGQAAFGEAVLKRITGDGVEVAGVSAPAPVGDRKDALWAAAEAAGLPVIDTLSLKTPEGQAAWRALGADLAMMAFVTEIIPNDVLHIPPQGTIQYHPSLLPLHRGSSAINWAIINGDRETGLSIFWPDQGSTRARSCCRRAAPSARTTRLGASTSTSCCRWAWKRWPNRCSWWQRGGRPGSGRTTRWRPTSRPAATDTRASAGTGRRTWCTGTSGGATRRRGPWRRLTGRNSRFSIAG
ncbi:MAG: formyltransferase family protein [Dehalococcoidia bacterium]|nr:formyltransferase family protein [Dehalococcoidia bacterium]